MGGDNEKTENLVQRKQQQQKMIDKIIIMHKIIKWG